MPSDEREGQASFFAMRMGDGLFLASFLALSALGFLIPSLRSEHFAGVALFGWWMAGLMVMVPTVALLRSWRARGRRP